ncbi:response regulator [Caballeronia sp. LjRoot34]|uniref:response regulator n=1 Tax=Caballeronia sp. LjRoot34 TaxID=3342325 RepID=UPI003ECDAB47
MIEDDVDVRTFLVDRLKMLGYTVTALHGRARLKRLKADNPDVLKVDFAIPGMNGLEVIAQAKRSRPQRPVILATGICGRACIEGPRRGRVEGYAMFANPFRWAIWRAP